MSNQPEDEARRMRREQGEKSVKIFARLYMSAHFTIPPCNAHVEIYDLLDQCIKRRGSKVVIAAPRGLGKSTVVTLTYLAYCVCYKKEPYVMVLSQGKSQACQILENLKRELETNPKLLSDFPELLSGKPKPWNHEQIQTLNGVRVAAFGHEQSIRGRRHGQYRPSLVIADDLEKADLGFNPETKEKLKKWFEQAVLQIGNSDTNYMLIGNFFHPGCLIGDYIDEQKHPDWIKRVYQAIVSWPNNTTLWDLWRKVYNSREEFQGARGPSAALAYYEANKYLMDEGAVVLWPGRWTLYELMVIHENNPMTFSAEYQNQPLNPMDCYFAPDAYQYWDEKHKTVDDLIAAFRGQFDFYCACDPSMGNDHNRGDYTAIVILARERKGGRLYHVLSDISRVKPHDAIELILAFYQRFRFLRFGIEANNFQIIMAQELQRRCRERGIYFSIVEIKNLGNKVTRIQSLQPLMKSGTLVLNKMNTLFNNELKYFPKWKYDDGLDALEMAVRIAGSGGQVVAKIIGGGGDNGWFNDYQRNLGWRF
jgi:predicted phage terminase large subunit-like protein